MLAAVFRCLAGYVVACIAAGVIQVSFVLPPSELVFTLHSGIFGAPFATIALVVAEWRRLRSPIYYAAAGFGISMVGYLTQITGHGFEQSVAVILYLLAGFAAAGVTAGLAYWLLAGRHAGRRGKRKARAEG